MDAELARIEHGKLNITRLVRKMDGVLPSKHGVSLRGPTTRESTPAAELFMTLPEAQSLVAVLRIDIPANGTERNIRVTVNDGRDFARIKALGITLFIGDLVADNTLREDIASVIEDMALMKFDQFGEERRAAR